MLLVCDANTGPSWVPVKDKLEFTGVVAVEMTVS
jgi:hypothetical protein